MQKIGLALQLLRTILLKTESVEMISVYLLEGCGKTWEE